MTSREKLSWAWFALLGVCRVTFALRGEWTAWSVVTVGQMLMWRLPR